MLYPLTDSSHIGLLVLPQCTNSFTPQLPEQLAGELNEVGLGGLSGVEKIEDLDGG